MGKETLVRVFETNSGYWAILVSLSSQKDTQLITVDTATGSLSHSGIKGLDVFPSEEAALQYISQGGTVSCRTLGQGRAILGYAALGSTGLLLLATRVRPTVRSLPGGDNVWTVTDSQWIKIPLHCPFLGPLSKTEHKAISELSDILINDVHFFCETRDVTRPFPSAFPVHDPDPEFVWNQWLTAPFRALGLGEHCAVLLQGLADSRSFDDVSGREVRVACIARRSRLHPGTRYLARGLNAASGTGNEIECEQIVWMGGLASSSPSTPQCLTPFSTFLWRRGTVPIWWGASIKSSIQDAEIFIQKKQPGRHTSRYFHRMAQRYTTAVGQEPPERHTANGIQGKGNRIGGRKPEEEEGVEVKMFCVDLLRVGAGKSELPLAETFLETLGKVNAGASEFGVLLEDQELGRGELGSWPNWADNEEEKGVAVPRAISVFPFVDYISLDWHATTKERGEAGAVSALWERLEGPLRQVGVSVGTFIASGSGAKGDFQETGKYAESEDKKTAAVGSAKGGLAVGTKVDNGIRQRVRVLENQGNTSGEFRMLKSQEGVVRFNCADSLDRTNAASFFAAAQALCEQCRVLGIPLDPCSGPANPALPDGSAAVPQDPEEEERAWRKALVESLPPGWEMRKDAGSGNLFYIDHSVRRTTWVHPCPPPRPRAVPAALPNPSQQPVKEVLPWERMKGSVWNFQQSVIPGALTALSDMFSLGGDVHATLYTGSKAMHAHVLQIFSELPLGSAADLAAGTGKKGAGSSNMATAAASASNMAITLQRRFLNLVWDSTRQRQLEIFLGLRLHRHLPGIPAPVCRPTLSSLTAGPHSLLLRPVPTLFPGLDSVDMVLRSRPQQPTVWVSPPSIPLVELYILLPEPCLVTHIMLHCGHGADDSSTPDSFEVKLGPTMDSLELILQEVKLPACASGLALVYPVPPSPPPEGDDHKGPEESEKDHETGSEKGHQLVLCPFEEISSAPPDFRTRVVAVTFYKGVGEGEGSAFQSASGSRQESPMTFGQVEILGIPLTPSIPAMKEWQTLLGGFSSGVIANASSEGPATGAAKTQDRKGSGTDCLPPDLLGCSPPHGSSTSSQSRQPGTGRETHSGLPAVDLISWDSPEGAVPTDLGHTPDGAVNLDGVSSLALDDGQLPALRDGAGNVPGDSQAGGQATPQPLQDFLSLSPDLGPRGAATHSPVLEEGAATAALGQNGTGGDWHPLLSPAPMAEREEGDRAGEKEKVTSPPPSPSSMETKSMHKIQSMPDTRRMEEELGAGEGEGLRASTSGRDLRSVGEEEEAEGLGGESGGAIGSLVLRDSKGEAAYRELLHSIVGSRREEQTKQSKSQGHLSLGDSLELEIARLRLGLPVHRRSAILQSEGIQEAQVDPNSCILSSSSATGGGGGGGGRVSSQQGAVHALALSNMATMLALTEADLREDQELAQFGFQEAKVWAGSKGSKLNDVKPSSEWTHNGHYCGWKRDSPPRDAGKRFCSRQHHQLGEGEGERTATSLSDKMDKAFFGSREDPSVPPSQKPVNQNSTKPQNCQQCGSCACPLCAARRGSSLLLSLRGGTGGGQLFTLNEPPGLALGASGPGRPPLEDSPLCRWCCPGELGEAVALLRLRQMGAEERKGRVTQGARKGAEEVLEVGRGAKRVLGVLGYGGSGNGEGDEAAREEDSLEMALVAPGEVSLAELPRAALVFQVPEFTSGASPHSILSPFPTPSSSVWDCSLSSTSPSTPLELTLSLAATGQVTRLVFLSGAEPYGPSTLPQIRVWASSSVVKKDRQLIAHFDPSKSPLPTIHAPAPHSGSNGTTQTPPNGGATQTPGVGWGAAAMTQAEPCPGSIKGKWALFSVNSDRAKNRTNSAGAPQADLDASALVCQLDSPENCRIVTVSLSAGPYGGNRQQGVQSEAGFRVRRLRVLGQFSSSPLEAAAAAGRGAGGAGLNRQEVAAGPVSLPSGLAMGSGIPSGSLASGVGPVGPTAEAAQKRALLERPSLYSRIKVSTDGERVKQGGRLLEIQITPSSPTVSGFRLEALPLGRNVGSTDAPGTVYTVGAQTGPPLASSDWPLLLDSQLPFASPFRIRVCRADPLGFALPQTLEEFVLPYTRPGVPLYFSFTSLRSISGLLSFELLGDLAYGSALGGIGSSLLSDDKARSSRGGGDVAVPFGSLSLAGKVKPFRLVPSAELGPLGQLSVI